MEEIKWAGKACHAIGLTTAETAAPCLGNEEACARGQCRWIGKAGQLLARWLVAGVKQYCFRLNHGILGFW